MPASIKKSFTRLSFTSKKLNSVVREGIANHSSSKLDHSSHRSNSKIIGCTVDAEAQEIIPEAVVLSDSSSSDDSSDSSSSSEEDEQQAVEKYGYGDAAPDDTFKCATAAAAMNNFPKRLFSRSSISKKSRRSNGSNLRRRSTISRSNRKPFHPERMPRRSSMKGSRPTVYDAPAGRCRCASVGVCNNPNLASIPPVMHQLSIEEEIAIGELQPDQVYEIQVPGRRESIQRRRTITFNDDVNICRIQPTLQVQGALSKQELWFQNDEYTTIKEKIRSLLSNVDENGMAVNGTTKYCIRGLEKYMMDPRQRANNKHSAWDSVMSEQEQQRNSGSNGRRSIFCGGVGIRNSEYDYDEETIAKLYSQTSIINVLEAAQRAHLDAEEVARMLL